MRNFVTTFGNVLEIYKIFAENQINEKMLLNVVSRPLSLTWRW